MYANFQPAIRIADTATELHKWSAVKSPLGAQTVLGDRHDPIVRHSIANSVGRLRNSPERTFQRLGTHFDLRVRSRDHVLREFAS